MSPCIMLCSTFSVLFLKTTLIILPEIIRTAITYTTWNLERDHDLEHNQEV